jgi:threonine/homoserine/homoserine lactone efflux protein
MLEPIKCLLLAVLFLFISIVNFGIVFVSISDYQYLTDNQYSLLGMYIVGVFFLGWGLWLIYDTVVEINANPDNIIF